MAYLRVNGTLRATAPAALDALRDARYPLADALREAGALAGRLHWRWAR